MSLTGELIECLREFSIQSVKELSTASRWVRPEDGVDTLGPRMMLGSLVSIAFALDRFSVLIGQVPTSWNPAETRADSIVSQPVDVLPSRSSSCCLYA